MTMTVMMFLDCLQTTPRAWRLVRVDRWWEWRRRFRLSLAETGYDPWAVVAAMARRLPFLVGPGACEPAVIEAAINERPGHDPKIRAALLWACGLA
jgi:hypothetical protein